MSLRQGAFRFARASLLCTLLLLIIVAPAQAATNQQTSIQAETPLDVTIYIPLDSLRPLIEKQLQTQMEAEVAKTMASLLNNTPEESRGWVGEMAKSLVQPSAKLTALEPLADGLKTSIQVVFFPQDPHPITTSFILHFRYQDEATIQVQATTIPDEPEVVNGDLTQIKLPFGKMQKVTSMINCGEVALAINLQLPVSLGGQASVPGNTALAANQLASIFQIQKALVDQGLIGASLVIPNASLAKIGPALGELKLKNGTPVRNIRLNIEDQNLMLRADVDWGIFKNLGIVSTVEVKAAPPKLGMVVKDTKTGNIFSLGSYNEEIQQTLNDQFNGALGGKFNVDVAGIGPTSKVSCAPKDGMLLTGTTSLG